MPVWRGAVGVLAVGEDVFGINSADMSKDGIWLLLESAQVQGGETQVWENYVIHGTDL